MVCVEEARLLERECGSVSWEGLKAELAVWSQSYVALNCLVSRIAETPSGLRRKTSHKSTALFLMPWLPRDIPDRHLLGTVSTANRAQRTRGPGAAQACALSSMSAFPPSITTSCPVTYDASADARNPIAAATSSGVPARCKGEASAAAASAGV